MVGEDPKIIRFARRIRRRIEAWKEAYRIVFPLKLQPAPEGSKQELPFSLQIVSYMAEQERLDGRRPTKAEAARHFGVHRSTITRQLAKVA